MAPNLYTKPELKELDKTAMGRRIRIQRDFLNMTREDLAFATDLSPKFIAEIEYGNKGISVGNLYKLSQVLEVSCDYLMGGAISGKDMEEKVSRIAENIIEPLKDCTPKQLEFMEKVAMYYKESMKEK